MKKSKKTVIEEQCENCHNYIGKETPMIGKTKIRCTTEGVIPVHSDHCAAQHIKDWSK